MSSSNYPIVDYTPVRPPLVRMEQTVKWKPNKIELAPDCPRCSSSNTKFCYYNNYSVSQPRYFCKACRRYWTKGGFLRNVPIGGGCRKSRRGRSTRQPPSVESSGSFAKYVDQDEENREASDFASNVGTRDGTAFECGKSAAEIQQVYECFDSQAFVYEGFDGLDVGGVFGAELWSEGTCLQSYGSELPLMQLQEFEVFASDDQIIKMSENLVSTDNWASFDLSGYENF